MKKIVRNMATAENRTFWETAERAAPEVQQWPAWKRAGINVAQVREQPREVPAVIPTATQPPGAPPLALPSSANFVRCSGRDARRRCACR